MFLRPHKPVEVPLLPGITRCSCFCHGVTLTPDENGLMRPPLPDVRPMATHEERVEQYGGFYKRFMCDTCYDEEQLAFGSTLPDWLEKLSD
jgi:hypothetical protein